MPPEPRAVTLTDQVTTDNPGVLEPGSVSAILAVAGRARPAISAFGGPQAAPAEGLSITYPVVSFATRAADDAGELVNGQANEKERIVSGKVSFDRGDAPLYTYAGGGDLSYQILRKSSPSYREAYVAVLTASWAFRTDQGFVADLLAAARTGSGTYAQASDSDGAKWAGVVGVAAAAIESRMQQPAGIVLVPSELYGQLAAKPLYVNQLVAAGRPIVHAPALPSGKAIVASAAAAAWYEDGSPHISTGEEVLQLGQDVAVWSLAAAAIHEPEGIHIITLS